MKKKEKILIIGNSTNYTTDAFRYQEQLLHRISQYDRIIRYNNCDNWRLTGTDCTDMFIVCNPTWQTTHLFKDFYSKFDCRYWFEDKYYKSIKHHDNQYGISHRDWNDGLLFKLEDNFHDVHPLDKFINARTVLYIISWFINTRPDADISILGIDIDNRNFDCTTDEGEYHEGAPYWETLYLRTLLKQRKISQLDQENLYFKIK